jgi:hypothetical protein
VERPLTRAEAVVAGTLLASPATSTRERIRQSGLASRTYEVARQRALDAGWLTDRFLPDPRIAGCHRATFALGRPFVEHRANRSRAWAAAPGNVLQWETSESIFAVFMTQDSLLDSVQTPELFAEPAFGHLIVIHADLDRPTVPVYFDFSGAWSRIEGGAVRDAYPRPIPHLGLDSIESAPSLLEDTRSLVLAPFRQAGSNSSGLNLARRFGQSARYRSRLSQCVERRYFLDPSQLPGFRDWSPSAIVFLFGRLREGYRPELLFRMLFVSCGITPFLFVTDGQFVLVGCLSPSPRSLNPSVRPSVTKTLGRCLREIEVFREPVSEIRTVTNHRYDRLFGNAAQRGNHVGGC